MVIRENQAFGRYERCTAIGQSQRRHPHMIEPRGRDIRAEIPLYRACWKVVERPHSLVCMCRQKSRTHRKQHQSTH
jgi:hypothetical protein